jgi:succinate-semialdehyde dehydrogenase/glutarate-semialdehyde dehydrogenase
VLGGPDAVAPPYVYPTILVDVPEDSAAVQEETFGPTLVVNRVASADEGVERANATRYGLGSAVFSRRHGMALARRIRSGMTSINAPLTFAGMPSLPFGGVGDSGIGRIHGDDGLREFGRAKAITRRRAPSLIAGSTFDRTDKQIRQMISAMKLLYGRRRR